MYQRFATLFLTTASLLVVLPVAAQQTTLAVPERAVFDWAEYAYPGFFAPAGAASQSLQGYSARFYSGTSSWLGMREQMVYAVGVPFAGFPNVGNGIRRLGHVDDFASSMLRDGYGSYRGERLLVSEAVSKDVSGGADWFELYNAGTLPVQLADYQVKDDGADHPLLTLPAHSLAPGEYVVVIASEKAVSGAQLQVAFNLGGSDRVQLYRQNLLMDELAWDNDEAEHGYSFGRFPGPLAKGSTIAPTPAAANKSEAGWTRNMFGSVGTLNSGRVHEISVTFDQAAYAAMVTAFRQTNKKEWIEGTVVIDGSTYPRVGLRLKGNSSLRFITTSTAPASVPWLVKFDKFNKEQNHKGMEEFVVRSNLSRSALNEAVALELLGLAGLASQDALAVRFRVNNSAPVARLVIESPDGEWMAEEFAATGALYKAESTGDYRYRGDDPLAYDEVFDQEAGDNNADLVPLIGFLRFINEADDAAFNAGLPSRLDIDSFASYLAMQDLLVNFDDIDGPGNNSYLYYDTAAKQFTIVPWDYNLAFGVGLVSRPPSPPLPGQGQQGLAPASSNVLVRRYLNNTLWKALYQQQLVVLRARLYGSGIASEIMQLWAKTISEGGLIDAGTLDSEKQAISLYFK